MKRIFVIILLLFSQYHIVYPNNIYEDAMTHFVEDIVESTESAYIESGEDSLYNYNLIFETDASYMRHELPRTIHGYRIINFGIPELLSYLDTVPEGIIRFFFVDKMDFCKKCQAQIFIRFVGVMVRKINSVIDFRYIQAYDVSYKYNCETNRLEYKYCVTGDFQPYDAIEFLRRKGLKGNYLYTEF
ncbi:MAG: hypothetical protein J6Y11_03295 [Paludibacteraceae bacterium]|nr:hypothetical protein [Paludibacteraceae bacterium]